MDAVSASLAEIYRTPKGEEKEDFAKIQHGRKGAWVFVVIGVIAFVSFLAAIAWLGFWWWGGRTTAAPLQIVVEGPERISLGQETTFFINWFNRSRDPLAGMELRVTFPPDFAARVVEPAAEGTEPGASTFFYRVGAQPGDAHGTIKIIGTFTGALGTKSAIQVIGTYRLATGAYSQERLETHPLEYADSVLVGALQIPAKVLPGDTVVLAYQVTNNGQDTLEGLEARFTLPNGFVRHATDTAGTQEGQIVRLPLPALDAGASSTVRVRGSFALGTHGDETVHAEAGRVSPDGSFAAAQKTDGSFAVLAGDLDIKLVINGSDTDRSAPLGERERVAISYHNMSGEELKDITLRVRFGGDPARTGGASTTIDLVDWRDLDDSGNGKRDHDTLTYTAESIEQLARLVPDGNGLIELAVPLIGNATSGRDVPIRASVEAVIGSVGGVKVNRTVTTKPLTIHLQTDATFQASAHYASEEGAPVGLGPLPPVAGTGTTYRIEWQVAKSFHALDRATVSATLPSSVSWASVKEVETGDVRYDPDRRLVTWNLGSLNATSTQARVAFDVTVIPSEADIGRFADLLGEARFEFTDAALGESLLRTAPAITTDLPNDTLAKGKGVVKKP